MSFTMSFIEIWAIGLGHILGLMTGLWLPSLALKNSSMAFPVSGPASRRPHLPDNVSLRCCRGHSALRAIEVKP